MLFPQTNAQRQTISLNGLWNFSADLDDSGLQQGWQTQLPDTADWMPVPSSYNDLTQNIELREHVGAVWYAKEIFIPTEWQDRRVVLRIGAAAHHATVFWNGKKITEHQGGFLPFEIEIDSWNHDKPNVCILRIDNRLSWSTLPPGILREKGDFPNSGTKIRQEYFHDFFNFSGIHRSVTLYSTPKTYLSNVRATPWRKEGTAGFDIETEIQGGTSEVSISIQDESGKEVASASGSACSVTIPEPKLWEPGKPYLYTLILKTQGPHADEYRLQVGLRTVRIEQGKFLINDKPFYFKGFGKHEDSDLLGKGHSDAVMVKDFNLLKWCGANSFRTAHYPYAEEILDHADRTGIVVIGELPAVGFDFAPNHVPFFQPGQIDEQTQAHHLQTLNEMILRDYNHPSIVLWSVANEASTREKASRPYFEPIIQKTRDLDPDRPVMIVMSAFPQEDLVGDLVDVIGVNRYFSWYHDVGELDTIASNLPAELQAWFDRYGKPIFMTEYGADAIAGFHQDPPVMFCEEYQVEVLEEYHKVFDSLPFMIGEHVWNFADFATKQGVKRVGGNKKGVFTRQRQPKLAAHALKRRWTNPS